MSDWLADNHKHLLRIDLSSVNAADSSSVSANANLVAPARGAFNIQRNSSDKLLNITTGQELTLADLRQEIANLSKILFEAIPAADKRGAANIDDFISKTTELNAREDAYIPNRNAPALSTNIKYAIFAYAHLKLLAFLMSPQNNKDFLSSTHSAKATAYQTTLTSEAERSAIAKDNYLTLLNMVLFMINENNNSPDKLKNVAKVLLFAIKGRSLSESEKTEVRKILGDTYTTLPQVDIYPGSADPQALDLLNQIIMLQITAGNDARLAYSTGYVPNNLTNNSAIVNTDADPLKNIKDVYVSRDVASATSNWRDAGVSTADPAAAQKAWDFYKQAQELLDIVRSAGVNLPAQTTLRGDISRGQNAITAAVTNFYGVLQLAKAATLTGANNALSVEEITAIRTELAVPGISQTSRFNPYRDFFNAYHASSATFAGAAALTGHLNRLETELGLTANRGKTITVRWDAILAKLESNIRQRAAQAEAIERANVQERETAIATLRRARDAEKNAGTVSAGIKAKPHVEPSTLTRTISDAETALNNAAQALEQGSSDADAKVNAALAAARSAADAAKLNITAIIGTAEPRSNTEKATAAEKLAKATEQEMLRRERETGNVKTQAATAERQQTAAQTAQEAVIAAVARGDLTAAERQSREADTAAGAAKAAADNAERIAGDERSGQGARSIEADEQAVRARQAAETARQSAGAATQALREARDTATATERRQQEEKKAKDAADKAAAKYAEAKAAREEVERLLRENLDTVPQAARGKADEAAKAAAEAQKAAQDAAEAAEKAQTTEASAHKARAEQAAINANTEAGAATRSINLAQDALEAAAWKKAEEKAKTLETNTEAGGAGGIGLPTFDF